jgi:hypothetical protein
MSTPMSTLLVGPLRCLVVPRHARSKRVSSWDKTGCNGDMWPLEPRSNTTIADIEGPGCITHIWMTGGQEKPFWPRRVVVRIFWDGEETPSVEAPLGDFFGVGHGERAPFECIVMGQTGTAFNCWWPMPFGRSARIEVANDSDATQILYFYVDHELYDEPVDTPLRFHAQWRRENPCDGWGPELDVASHEVNSTPNLGDAGNYLLLDAEGAGHYCGCNLSIHNERGQWWGEGDDMMFIDGEGFPPSLHGTGSEDYFSHAYGMQDQRGPFNGTSLFNRQHTDCEGKWTVYRYHILDPVCFTQSIRVSIEHGHANHRADDYSSTAYWYQTEPHKPFPAFPDVKGRLPRDAAE